MAGGCAQYVSQISDRLKPFCITAVVVLLLLPLLTKPTVTEADNNYISGVVLKDATLEIAGRSAVLKDSVFMNCSISITCNKSIIVLNCCFVNAMLRLEVFHGSLHVNQTQLDGVDALLGFYKSFLNGVNVSRSYLSVSGQRVIFNNSLLAHTYSKVQVSHALAIRYCTLCSSTMSVYVPRHMESMHIKSNITIANSILDQSSCIGFTMDVRIASTNLSIYNNMLYTDSIDIGIQPLFENFESEDFWSRTYSHLYFTNYTVIEGVEAYPCLFVEPRAGSNILGGSVIGGNFWVDRSTNLTDADGDGFGDTVVRVSWCYVADGQKLPLVDAFPLLSPNRTYPLLFVIHPLNGSHTSDSTELRWLYSGPEAEAEVLLDGDLVWRGTGSSCMFQNLSKGWHQATVRIAGVNRSVWFYVDSSPPSLAVNAPTIAFNRIFPLTVTVSDAEGPVFYRIRFVGRTGRLWIINTTDPPDLIHLERYAVPWSSEIAERFIFCSSGEERFWVLVPELGRYILEIEAFDAAGNVACVTVTTLVIFSEEHTNTLIVSLSVLCAVALLAFTRRYWLPWIRRLIEESKREPYIPFPP